MNFDFIQAYDKEHKNAANISTTKVQPTMRPFKDPKFLREKIIFMCFKIIATYINPALYCIFFIVYVIIYAN